MKVKRLLILVTSIFLLSTATVFADSIWGTYEGYSKARVIVNDSELNIPSDDVPAFVINGRTMMPLRAIAESLQAAVKWDGSNMTAKVYKPNIHMFVSKDVEKDYSIKKPFGKVSRGESMNFVVSTQVDNLLFNTSGFRLSITAPDGSAATDSLEVPLSNPSESFWYLCPFHVNFDQSGTYTINFSFLVDGEYMTVAKKEIVSE